jgi:hypothetical protein
MGLWSVKMVKRRTSSIWRKYFTASDGQQLAVVGAVLLLGRVQFFKEGEWLPGLLDMLL